MGANTITFSTSLNNMRQSHVCRHTKWGRNKTTKEQTNNEKISVNQRQSWGWRCREAGDENDKGVKGGRSRERSSCEHQNTNPLEPFCSHNNLQQAVDFVLVCLCVCERMRKKMIIKTHMQGRSKVNNNEQGATVAKNGYCVDERRRRRRPVRPVDGCLRSRIATHMLKPQKTRKVRRRKHTRTIRNRLTHSRQKKCIRTRSVHDSIRVPNLVHMFAFVSVLVCGGLFSLSFLCFSISIFPSVVSVYFGVSVIILLLSKQIASKLTRLSLPRSWQFGFLRPFSWET